jgi:hypothetical protein
MAARPEFVTHLMTSNESWHNLKSWAEVVWDWAERFMENHPPAYDTIPYPDTVHITILDVSDPVAWTLSIADNKHFCCHIGLGTRQKDEWITQALVKQLIHVITYPTDEMTLRWAETGKDINPARSYRKLVYQALACEIVQEAARGAKAV